MLMDHTRKIDHLVKLAAQNPSAAALYEPRVYFDVVTPGAQDTIVAGRGDAFVNEERFPIMVRKLVLASTASGDDPAQLARVGLRLKFRDHAYMARDFLPATNWQNVLTGGAYSTQWSTSHQVFDHPVIMGLRDSLFVRAELTATPGSTRRISVAFHGVGLKSLRPYVLSDVIDATDTTEKTFQTSKLRNDGSELIALTGWSITVSGEENDSTVYADIRLGRVQIRLLGNGTTTDWFKGPIASGGLGYTKMPAVLAGTAMGQGIVHHFPGDGIRLEPNQGMELEVLAFDSSGTSVDIGVAAHGMLLLR